MLASLGLVLAAGCAGPGRPLTGTPVASGDPLFSPIPVPHAFDRHRALLPLARIPDDPPAPATGDVSAAPSLPRRAVRLLAEARRLLAEHRYTETTLELEKALSYSPGSYQCHRMMAVACLMSGNESRALLSAQRALAIKPDDLTCHYVLGRLADKREKPDQAIRAYRIALKCKSTGEADPGAEAVIGGSDASYRVLTHYRLGTLLDLDEAGYLTAAIEQYEAFASGLEAIGPQVDENPELATVARIHRSEATIRTARAYGILGDYPAAARALEKATARSPRDFDLRGEYVRMLVRAGRIDEAAAQASRFVADSKGSRRAVALLLAVHRHAGTPQAGAAAIEAVIAEQPDNIDLWLLYADALAAADHPARAVETLNKLIAKHPTASEARWKLTDLHRAEADWPAWLTALAGALVAQPADYGRVSEDLAKVPPDIARRIVDESLDETGREKKLVPSAVPDDAMAAALDYLLGRLCGQLDRVDDAIHFFERSVQRSPRAEADSRCLPGRIGLAELYVERCRWNDAIRALRAADPAASGPGASAPATAPAPAACAAAERLLGQCHDGLDAFEPAVEHYRKAIQLDRADARSMMLLGQLCERWGRPKQARRQYQSAITAAPEEILTRELYLRTLLAAGDDPAATTARASLEFAEMQRRAPKDPATIRCSAILKFIRDRDRDAYFEALRSVIRTHPDDVRSRVELATALFTFHDYEGARLEASEILALEPRSPQAGELMALALMRLLDFEQSAAEFQRIVDLYPNRRTWLRNFAELRMVQQNYDAATELWTRLLAFEERVVGQVELRGRLIEAYRLARQFDEARRVAQRWLQEADSQEPVVRELTRTGARWFLLSVDQAEGDDGRYLERCRQWLEADSSRRELRSWLVGISTAAPLGAAGQFEGRGGLLGAGRFDEAIVQILEWLAEAPDDTTLIRWLAEALQSARRHDEALELARSLLATEGEPEAALTPARIVQLYILEMMYTRARRYDEAVATARDRIALVERLLPQAEPLRRAEWQADLFEQDRRIGSLLSQAGHFNDAIAHLNKMIVDMDDDQRKADLLRTLAYVHQRRGSLDLAQQRLREAYQLAPADAGLNNDLGYTLANAGQELKEAERMIRLAVGQAPRQPAYLDSLGWALYKKGELDDAKTWLSRAAAHKQGEDAMILDHLGDAQWRLGEKNSAVQSWRRALEVYEQQWADGETDANEKLVAGLRRKLEAVTSGTAPPVAPIAGEGSGADRGDR